MSDGYTTNPEAGNFSEETKIRMAAEVVRTAFEEIAEVEKYSSCLNGLCGRAAVQFMLEMERMDIKGVLLIKGSGHGFCCLSDGRIVDMTATQFSGSGAPSDGYSPVEIGREHPVLPSWYQEQRCWPSFDAWKEDTSAGFFGARGSWKQDRKQVKKAWKRLMGKM